MPKGLMLTDLAIAGLLLIVAKVIRVHTPLLQRMALLRNSMELNQETTI
ncbi:hypothetical protein O4N62_19645 [Vibrio parahaemolyticus]|nr:hypothetical protein [Vibrio parahaemolyticus]MCZ6022844.1 hypothetical protein [Vibrio parahaemolyticus]